MCNLGKEKLGGEGERAERGGEGEKVERGRRWFGQQVDVLPPSRAEEASWGLRIRMCDVQASVRGFSGV